MAGKKYSIEFMLGAGLESTFAKSFNSASNTMKELQTKVNEIGKHRAANTTRGVRDDLSKTRQAMVLTQNATSKMSSMISRSFAAIGGIYAAYRVFSFGKDIVNTYAEFENEMQRVKALSGATGEELAALTKEAKRLNATTVFTGKEAADGMAFLAMAGYKTNDILAAMPGLLSAAAAGKEDLGTTADITSNILQGFGIAAEETGRVADVLTKAFTSSNVTMGMIGETMKYVAPQSKAAGISLEETAAAAGILGNAGIQASMAGTGLRSIIARMAAPTGGAAKLMKKLGIETINADGSLKDLAGIVEEVTKGTEKMGEAERIAAIKTLAGQYAASSMLSLMDVGADKLREFTTELENSGGAAQQIADTQLDSLTGSMTLLESAVQAAKIAVGEKMAPSIRKLADNISANLPRIVEQFDATWKAMTNTPSWENADWLGRFQIGWDKLISSPFKAWWAASGKAEFQKVANEIGRAIKASIAGVVKEAFTGSGATQFLAAGALAIPGMKIGSSALTTVATLKSLGVAGGVASTGVAGATKAAGLFGPALGLLLNPVGLTVAGLAGLTGAVIAYRKHQEKSRQALINMGDTLNEAEGKYQAVADKAELTQSLADEYRTLDDQVKNNVGTAEELADAQQRMADITALLQDMFPQTLTDYDIEKGKMLEKLGLMEQMTEAEREREKLRLEATVAEGRSKQGKLEKEIGNLTGDVDKANSLVDKIYAEKEAIDNVIPIFQQYENELMRLSELDRTPEVSGMIEKLISDASELGNSIGWNVHGLNLYGMSDSLLKELGEKGKELNKALDKRDLKLEELQTAKDSYQELYDAQVNIIELDLGSTLEQAAENYRTMTDTERARFDEALISIDQINNQMKLLTDEPFTIHVQTVFDEAHQLTGVPYSVRESANAPVFKGMAQYADGGFASQASIFGEAGLEAAIPIDNRPRSHAILDQVNRMMGHGSSESGGGKTNITFAPNITVQGGGPDTARQVRQATEEAFEQFKSMYEQMIRDERRLAF